MLAQRAADARSVAWLTADDADNDPVLLFSYLAAALDRILPLDPDVFAAIRSGAVSTRARSASCSPRSRPGRRC